MGISLFAARNAIEFTIYLWGLPEGDDPEVVARSLPEAGFTLVDGGRETIDVYAKPGHWSFRESRACQKTVAESVR